MAHGEARQEADGAGAMPAEHMFGPSFPAHEPPIGHERVGVAIPGKFVVQ